MKVKSRFLCIANPKTDEVLRVTEEIAYESLPKGWYLTSKTVYKQYREHKKYGIVPAPKFRYNKVLKDGTTQERLKNVFQGRPSIRKITRSGNL